MIHTFLWIFLPNFSFVGYVRDFREWVFLAPLIREQPRKGPSDDDTAGGISYNTVFIPIYGGITPYKARKSLEVSACFFMASRFQSYCLETLLFSITSSTNP